MNTFWMILIYVGALLIMFVPMFLSNKRRKAKLKNMLDSLNVGDTVVTIGGIYGKIIELSADTVEIKVDKQARLTITKAAVSHIVSSLKTNNE